MFGVHNVGQTSNVLQLNLREKILKWILQTQFMQSMDALCEFGAYKSEGKQVKPRDFLWSIMLSGILISVMDHPYSTSAKRCEGQGGQILIRAKSVKGKNA